MTTRRMASLPYISPVRNKPNLSNRSILYEDYWAHMSWCEQESTAAGPECASLSKQSDVMFTMLKTLLLTYLPATGPRISLPTTERPSWWSEALSSRKHSSSSKPSKSGPKFLCCAFACACKSQRGSLPQSATWARWLCQLSVTHCA